MTNYSNGKIYKIEPICDHDESDIYIGSTTKEYISQRMVKHRGDYKVWKNGKTDNTSVYNLFEKYGVENCIIILLETVNANSKDELRAREAHYIKSLKCINKVVPKRTPQEYREDTKDKKQQYFTEYKENNLEKIKEKDKKYYNLNKDKINERKRELRKLKKLELQK